MWSVARRELARRRVASRIDDEDLDMADATCVRICARRRHSSRPPGAGGLSRLRMDRIGVAAVIYIACAPLVSGCGDQVPTYTKSSVCGVPASVMRNVMGTNRFSVGQSVERSAADQPPAPKGGGLPLNAGSGGIVNMGCDVHTTEDGPALSFTLSLHPGSDAALMEKQIQAKPQPFQTGGGVATTNFIGDTHSAWRWVCMVQSFGGTPTAGGSIDVHGVTERDRRAFVSAVAKAAGCPAADPRRG